MGIPGTPTAEEYAKALAKVSKNLAKDSIFYTNQLAGNNKKVDFHDQMVDATAKNTVDTFNGMKKIKDLKEDHSKNPDDKYTVKPCKTKGEPWAVWEGEKRVKGFATKEEAKEYADSQNKKQGLTESVLKEGIKNLIKKALMENEEDTYEMQGPKSDAEYKRELENYLEDNQIYGYTDMLFDILTAPDEEQVADNLADFLDDHQIYGYNKGLLAIFRDYANRDQSEDEWDEADYERMSNSIEDKKAPEIPGFEGTRDALDKLFEATEFKDEVGGNLMLNNAAKQVYQYIKKNGFPVRLVTDKGQAIGDSNPNFIVSTKVEYLTKFDEKPDGLTGLKQTINKVGITDGGIYISGIGTNTPVVKDKLDGLQSTILSSFNFLEKSGEIQVGPGGGSFAVKIKPDMLKKGQVTESRRVKSLSELLN